MPNLKINNKTYSGVSEVHIPLADGSGNEDFAYITSEAKNITENGSHDVKHYGTVNVNVPSEGIVPTGTKTITENGTYDVTEYANAKVAVPAEEPNIQSLRVTANGTYTAPSGVDGYSPITVDVPTESDIELQQKTVTPSETAQTITPDSGYDGLSSVSVGAISKTYVGSGVTRKSAQTYTPGTTAQEIPSNVYLTGKQTISAIQTQTKTVTANGTVTPDPGKYLSSVEVNVPASGIDTSDATATAADIAAGVTAYVNGEKVTGVVNAYSEYETYVGLVYDPDSTSKFKVTNFSLPENGLLLYAGTQPIFNIFTDLGDATASDVTKGKTFTSASGLKLTGTYEGSGGIDTSDATATADDIEQGKTAYVNGQKVTGSLPVLRNMALGEASSFDIIDDIFVAYCFNEEKKIIPANHNLAISTYSSAFGNATAADVAKGKTFTSASGLKITGTNEGGAKDPFALPFTYTVNDISGAAHGFALNDSGYFESQNKGVNSSYAICRVNLTVNETSDIIFDVINYAESSYDYALFGNLDSPLTLSASADSSVKQSFKNMQSASVVNVTYSNVATGTHYIDIKFIKDGSQNKDNDSVQFKIQNVADLSQETIDKILNAEPDIVPENIKSGVSIFGVLGTYVGTGGSSGGGLPNGVTALASGEVIPAEDITSTLTVTHNLGAVPDFLVWWDTTDLTGSVESGTAFLGAVFEKQVKNSATGSLIFNHHYLFGAYSASGSLTTSGSRASNPSRMTDTIATIVTSSSYRLKAGRTFRWVCGVMA